ncbi:hypothetical protein PRIC1_001889 [Phytophthora ramorum]|nr:hypothetical protein KRP22_1077 [Phytophthora ramorum]
MKAVNISLRTTSWYNSQPRPSPDSSRQEWKRNTWIEFPRTVIVGGIFAGATAPTSPELLWNSTLSLTPVLAVVTVCCHVNIVILRGPIAVIQDRDL